MPHAAADASATAAQPVSSKKGVKRYENGFEVHNVKMGDPHGKLAKAGKQVRGVQHVSDTYTGQVQLVLLCVLLGSSSSLPVHAARCVCAKCTSIWY